ncbi:mCG120000 [Mus musculus]|nr:mCG120000 [Mus musculus]
MQARSPSAGVDPQPGWMARRETHTNLRAARQHQGGPGTQPAQPPRQPPLLSADFSSRRQEPPHRLKESLWLLSPSPEPSLPG